MKTLKSRVNSKQINSFTKQYEHHFHYNITGDINMASKTAKYAREALVKIVNSRRQGGRCAIVKELTDEGNVAAADYNGRIKKLNAKIEKLKADVKEEENARDKFQSTNLLHSGNFSKTEDGQCRWRQLHPRLDAYDKQTDHCVIELMTRPEVDESTIIELLGEDDGND